LARGAPIRWPRSIARILTSSDDNPTVITTDRPHGLTTGDRVRIAEHTGSTPALDGYHAVTVTGDDTFTVAVNVSVARSGGLLYPATEYANTAAAVALVECVPGGAPALVRATWRDLSTDGAVMSRIHVGVVSTPLIEAGDVPPIIDATAVSPASC